MKLRKQMRGFDVTQYLAFGTFPNIQNVELLQMSDRFDVNIMDKRTGEVMSMKCFGMKECRELAKLVNRMVRDNTKWLEEHHEEH